MKKTLATLLISTTLTGSAIKNSEVVDPIEAQKNTIIMNMNRLLSDNNIKLPLLNDCMILVKGSESSEKFFVGLSCEDGVVIEKFYDAVNPTTYTTLIKNIRSRSGKLTNQGSCFQMITPDETGENQIIESADCLMVELQNI